MSLEAAAAAAPRVSNASMEVKIRAKFEFVLNYLEDTVKTSKSLSVMSVCVLVLENGFLVIGNAASTSTENFNRALGQKFAYENAICQLLPHEGSALRERLNNAF